MSAAPTSVAAVPTPSSTVPTDGGWCSTRGAIASDISSRPRAWPDSMSTRRTVARTPTNTTTTASAPSARAGLTGSTSTCTAVASSTASDRSRPRAVRTPASSSSVTGSARGRKVSAPTADAAPTSASTHRTSVVDVAPPQSGPHRVQAPRPTTIASRVPCATSTSSPRDERPSARAAAATSPTAGSRCSHPSTAVGDAWSRCHPASAAAATSIGYLHTSSGQERLRAAVEARLSQRVNGSATVGRVGVALGGDLVLGDVRLRDAQGDQAIALGTLRVTPAWRRLLGGDLEIAAIAIEDVELHLVKHADGTSNLSSLFVKSPPSDEKREPMQKPITIRHLAIRNVDVRIEQPDGTIVTVTDAGLEGHATALLAKKNLDLSLEPIAADLLIEKPEGALTLRVSALRTGIRATVEGDTGELVITPVSGNLLLVRKGLDDVAFPLSLGETRLALDHGTLDAAIGALAFGAVALSSIEIKGGVADGKLAGRQDAHLVGLKLAAAEVNSLVGRPLLATDVDARIGIAGPPEALVLDAAIDTRGGNLRLAGSVDASDPASPKYDLSVSAEGVATKRLLASETAPDVTVDKVSLTLKGAGRDKETLASAIGLAVDGARARGIPIDHLEARARVDHGKMDLESLRIQALDQTLTASGTYGLVDRDVDLRAAIVGDPGKALDALRRAGLPVKTQIPVGFVRIDEGALAVTVRGKADQGLDLAVDGTKIGIGSALFALKAKARLEPGTPPEPPSPPLSSVPGSSPTPPPAAKLALTHFDASLDLVGLTLADVLRLRGKKVEGLRGRFDVHVEASGTPTAPAATVRARAEVERVDHGAPPVLLDIDARLASETLRVGVRGKRGTEPLLTLDGKVPLHLSSEPKGIDPTRKIDLALHVPRTAFADLVALVPPKLLEGKKLPTAGGLALDVRAHGTRDRLDANVTLDADPTIGTLSPRVHLVASLDPQPQTRAHKLLANADIGLGEAEKPLVRLAIEGDLDRSPLVAGLGLDWNVALDAGPVALAELPITNERVKALGGTAEARVALHGNLRDASGKVTVAAHDLRPNGGGPLDAAIALTLGEKEATLDGRFDLQGGVLATIDGRADVGGAGLVSRIRRKEPIDPRFEAHVTIPKRPLASLAALRPNLEGAPGSLSGRIDVHGTRAMPLGEGHITLSDILFASQERGGAAIDLAATESEISARVALGPQPDAPFHLAAKVERAALTRFATGEPLVVRASLDAQRTPLARLVPADVTSRFAGFEMKGTLDTHLEVSASLAKSEEKAVLADGSVDGHLRVDAPALPLPGTKRSFRDVTIDVQAAGGSVAIKGIRARETDLQVKDRAIDVEGVLELDRLYPKHLDLDVRSSRWLLFAGGGKNAPNAAQKILGRPDAPRGELDIDLHVSGALDAFPRRIDARVKKLALLVPDRFDKAHASEELGWGDVLFVSPPKSDVATSLLRPDEVVAVGKLPVPESVKKADETAKAPPIEVAPDPSGGLPSLVATVTIEPGARLLQSPIELYPEGKLTIEKSAVATHVRGRLEMKKGELSLGGATHPLSHGSLVFDEAHPKGFIDLYFARSLPPSALRNVSEASAGQSIDIHMFGAISDRTTQLSGSGSPGTLFDLLAMHNEGRERLLSAPGMPVSTTVAFPQHDNLLVLSFLAVNLPHLLFIDRVAAWSDAYDKTSQYGRIEHYEAEEGLGSNDSNLRLVLRKRPPSAGESEAEAEIDYLFMQTPRTAIGAGLVGGSRAGGGAAIFLDWSSKD